MSLAAVTLDDKYTLERGRVYLTGTQALVRLPMMQRQRDVASGLDTACFVSGYRGSPLGGLDQALWNARRFLERNHIRREGLLAWAVEEKQAKPSFRLAEKPASARIQRVLAATERMRHDCRQAKIKRPPREIAAGPGRFR